MRAINTDIVVVGAGIAGLSAALGLASAGLKVTHLRQQAAPEVPPDPARPFDRRVYAISPGSRGLLENLGVWRLLPTARVAPVYDMRVYPQADPNARELHLSAYEAGCEALAWIIESGALIAALEQALSFSRLNTVVGSLATYEPEATPERGELTLDNGQIIRARLVVGADGAGSPVRGQAGIAQSVKPYQQKALVAPLALERPHRDGAWQWFGRHGVLALLPMPMHEALDFTATFPDLPRDSGGMRASLVWSAPIEQAEQMLADGPEALSQALTDLAGHAFGRIRVLEPAAGFELRLCSASSMIAPRTVLVGDAAHVIHPLAGQGLNLGLADVTTLLKVLEQARGHYRKASFDPGNALLLRRFQRQRAEPVAAMQQITDILSRVFDPTKPLVAGLPGFPPPLLRDAGWAVASGSKFLRQQFVRYATQQF